MVQILWIAVLTAVLLVVFFKILPFKRVIVYEYQRGLKYTQGKYVGTLEPGQHWILSILSSISPVDIRPQFITILGQEVLSADGVTLKISLAAEYEVTDPHLAINKNLDFRTSLYLNLQLALREIIGNEKIDAVLENRAAIGAKLMEIGSRKATALGLHLISADAKDIMFPGEMKKVFGQVVKAQKEGQAALERARGETAALRSLANAARITADNPNLLQLRALQVLSESQGNTMVLGLPDGVLPIRRPPTQVSTPPPKEEDPGGE